MIQKTPYYSWKTGALARGCELCVRGEKTVLFITGLCSQHCYYCPISDIKKERDVIYANERPISKVNEFIGEVKLCSSKGVGITGGDPITRIERVIEYIKALKNEFGKEFHVHLYTPLNLITQEILDRLYEAGLDEIRFHPELEDRQLWKKIALQFRGIKGVEIPVIPGKEDTIKELIDLIKDRVNFLNLNELEYSDTNAQSMAERGFFTKNSLSYAIKGSEELAKKLLRYCNEKGIGAHYCTATLKDRVQLRNRIKKRAKNVATKYDRITGDGTLVRNVLYLNLKPGFEYKKKLQNETLKNEELGQLVGIQSQLSFPTILDKNKPRLITSLKHIAANKKRIAQLGLTPAIVEEYPTWDALETEIEFL